MTTPPPQVQGSPRWPMTPTANGIPPDGAGQVADWLDRQEQRLVHPRVVADELLRAGWHPNHAASAAVVYRRRFNEHTLGYTALLVSTGIAALSAGTVGHLLTAGLDHPLRRNALGLWLTLLVCSLPFAVVGHAWAAKVDRDDPVAVWSQPRRSLARALLWASGIVGIGRLVIYAARLIGVLVGASWGSGNSAAAGTINVAITIGLALPLGVWSFQFLHRFDAEDPATPAARRRRAAR